ncbi:MAG: hypothetical protein J7K15_10290 [Deltaproteobacteria bacterium]|nr:hypothetical protein [Deltaproteobacteria bacterium]
MVYCPLCGKKLEGLAWRLRVCKACKVIYTVLEDSEYGDLYCVAKVADLEKLELEDIIDALKKLADEVKADDAWSQLAKALGQWLERYLLSLSGGGDSKQEGTETR